MWTFRDVTTGTDVTGYDVEALDGAIGRVEETIYDVRGSFVVVDTGDRKAMLPAGVIDRVDTDSKTVWVIRTLGEIEGAPAFDEDRVSSDEYRAWLREYYGPGGPAWRESG
jgi:hypothetical protein